MNASYRNQSYPTPILPLEQRLPPQDLAVERTVLGSMLVSQTAAGEAFTLLDDTCFYMAANRHIFNCMREMFEKHIPIDIATLADALKKKNLLEIVGEETYLGELAESIATSGNIGYYAGILRDVAARRAAIEEHYQGIERAFNLDDPFYTPAEWTLENTRPDWILQEPEPFEFIIPGLLAKGVVGFFYGSGGTYKSLAVLWLVLQRGTGTVVSGQRWLDRFPVPFGRSIFFSAEDVQIDMHHRIDACIRAMHDDRIDVPINAIQSAVLENCRIIPREVWTNDGEIFIYDSGQTGKVDSIVKLVNDFCADLIIIETASRIAAIDEIDNGQNARLVACLESIRDRTGATVLLLDHSSKIGRTGKTDLQGQNSLRGASAKMDNARFGLLIEPQKRENGSDVLKITNSKSFRCKRADSFRVSVEYPRFTLIEGNTGDETVFDNVIEYVREHPGTSTREIRKGVTGKTTAISQAIRDGKEEGILIFKKGKGFNVQE